MSFKQIQHGVDYIPESLLEPLKEQPKIDLSKLKVGDKVKFRNGSTPEVEKVYLSDSSRNYPYVIVFSGGVVLTYTKEGSFGCAKSPGDIVEIISKEPTALRINLHNLAAGDSVYCDDGSEHVVDFITFERSYAVVTFYDFGTFEFNYNGSKFQEDAEVGNIVHVLHGAPESKEPTKTVDQADPVNHPSHYTSGGIECITAIKASMTPDAYKGYLKGNILKYIWRFESKGKPAEDLKKARTYLEWLIKEVTDAED